MSAGDRRKGWALGALPVIMMTMVALVTFSYPAVAGVKVIPQTVRVCIAQNVSQASFTVQGKYRLIDGYSGEVIASPSGGESWVVSRSGNGIEVFSGRKRLGRFSGSVILEEVKDRVFVMAGSGAVVQKDSALELAVQGANEDTVYMDGNFSDLWVQGKDVISALVPSGATGTVDVAPGNGHPRRTYRGGFDFRVSGDGGLLVINQLGIEEYLYGVVPAEMSHEFPPEALKAQAVAARSYLMAGLGNYSSHGFDLLASRNSQVYKGYAAESPETNRAVDATRGEVLVFRGQVIPAYFHASSGGVTENSEDVWSTFLPYIRSKPDKWDRNPGNERHYNWQVVYSRANLLGNLAAAGYDFREITDLKVMEYTSSGRRVKRLLISGRGPGGAPRSEEVANANAVRTALGLKSAMFSMREQKDASGRLSNVVFTGSGWGHGLGMSQWGARGMAENGYNHRKILQYYYTGVSIAGNYGR